MYMKSHENIVSCTHTHTSNPHLGSEGLCHFPDLGGRLGSSSSGRCQLDGDGKLQKKIWLLTGDNQLMLLWIKAKKE